MTSWKLLVPQTERFIRSRLRCALADADYEDVMATALGNLWYRRHRFDPSHARLDHWFYVLARNAALDLLRRRKRRREEPLGEDFADARARELAVSSKYTRLRVDLSRALATVSETDRRILLSGLTETELSRELGLRPGTIRVRRSRTKQKVRLALQRMGHTITE